MQQEWAGLLFGVQRSARYHSRRESFFIRLDRLNSFVSIVLGTTTVAAILQAEDWPSWIKLAAPAAITCLSALDLVIGFSERAKQHAEFRRRYCAIEACMTGAANEADLDKCKKDRLGIEAGEPPKMFALDLLCHNELLRALGFERANPKQVSEFRHVNWFQQLTANMWPWEGATFERETVRPRRWWQR